MKGLGWLAALLVTTTAAQTLEDLGIKVDKPLVRVQGFVAVNAVQEGSFNPENRLAALSDNEFNFEVRPDLSLTYRNLDMLLKPRFQYLHGEGNIAGEGFQQDETSVFVNEGRVRLGLRDRLFLSYGREVLLWGPAMFLSASNPFFVENGQSNPYRELGGRDYLKAVYFPNNPVTLSLISNTDLGRDELIDQSAFRRTDAAKIDYVGTATSGSLILSQQREGPERIGGHWQWTLSEALLVYAEGGFTFGSESLYPLRISDPPGWTFAAMPGSRGIGSLSLAGFSYTFVSGLTMAVEYVYNAAGYSGQEAEDYFTLVEEASQQFLGGGPASASAAAALLAQARAPRLPLLRRHYLFLQFLRTNLRDQLDLTVRYTRNLDDDGSSLVPIAEWNANEYLRLFALGLFNFGSERTEFQRYLDQQILGGINVTF